MGLSLSAYFLLALLGVWIAVARHRDRPVPSWARWVHIGLGVGLVLLVLLLLSIGIVGTLGEYGRLGHSWHLPAGLLVVGLVLASAASASQIAAGRPWARSLHRVINGLLFFALATVAGSGWLVVQKYLP